MAVSDAIYWHKKKLGKKYLNKQDINKATNEGAKNFLNLLIKTK
jgi:hypothetical protein